MLACARHRGYTLDWWTRRERQEVAGEACVGTRGRSVPRIAPLKRVTRHQRVDQTPLVPANKRGDPAVHTHLYPTLCASRLRAIHERSETTCIVHHYCVEKTNHKLSSTHFQKKLKKKLCKNAQELDEAQ